MMLKIAHLGKQIRNTREDFKCGSSVQKTDVLRLQAFLREKFNLWVGNGSGVEEIWKSYKDIIVEGIKRYVHQTILSKNPKPEYYKK
jgi:hypothetical protein